MSIRRRPVFQINTNSQYVADGAVGDGISQAPAAPQTADPYELALGRMKNTLANAPVGAKVVNQWRPQAQQVARPLPYGGTPSSPPAEVPQDYGAALGRMKNTLANAPVKTAGLNPKWWSRVQQTQ